MENAPAQEMLLFSQLPPHIQGMIEDLRDRNSDPPTLSALTDALSEETNPTAQAMGLYLATIREIDSLRKKLEEAVAKKKEIEKLAPRWTLELEGSARRNSLDGLLYSVAGEDELGKINSIPQPISCCSLDFSPDGTEGADKMSSSSLKALFLPQLSAIRELNLTWTSMQPPALEADETAAAIAHAIREAPALSKNLRKLKITCNHHYPTRLQHEVRVHPDILRALLENHKSFSKLEEIDFADWLMGTAPELQTKNPLVPELISATKKAIEHKAPLPFPNLKKLGRVSLEGNEAEEPPFPNVKREDVQELMNLRRQARELGLDDPALYPVSVQEVKPHDKTRERE